MERANEHRSRNVVSWWNDRAAEVLLNVHCSSDQGEDDGDALVGL